MSSSSSSRWRLLSAPERNDDEGIYDEQEDHNEVSHFFAASSAPSERPPAKMTKHTHPHSPSSAKRRQSSAYMLHHGGADPSSHGRPAANQEGHCVLHDQRSPSRWLDAGQGPFGDGSHASPGKKKEPSAPKILHVPGKRPLAVTTGMLDVDDIDLGTDFDGELPATAWLPMTCLRTECGVPDEVAQ